MAKREFYLPSGFVHKSAFLDIDQQNQILSDIRNVVVSAPMFSPLTRWGKPMRVRMTSAGRYGWYSDRSGYRYIAQHPSGCDWPEIPPAILSVWRALIDPQRMPDCCLINYYDSTARMGLHQDRDEADFGWPVLSISLGDDGLFRLGGKDRDSPTKSFWLKSGDVVILGGAARLCYHGIDRIRTGSSSLLPNGGRLNLTLRVVD